MSYQALYRVWRPQTFDELVGQGMISATLKNAVKNEQLSHAYLFTGPRGTGKTSAAKILAKAVNCPNQTDGNPCNDCEICRLINSGQLSDVVEIDAASNNGVEEIRDLRDNVRYAASQADYKVYIIDEVHMLTTGAFNALLKTLEEPPEQVVFILATTEPHKIPATIISRTQRYDFKRIQQGQMVDRMAFILDHDKVEYDSEALEIIARAANGGLRDALSLLDQVLSFSTESVTVDAALEVSGSLSQIDFVKYILAIYQQKSEEALEILGDQFKNGKQASRFIEELILFSRDVLLTVHTKRNQTLLSDAELQPLTDEIAGSYYYVLIDHLNEAQNKMRFSNQPDIYVEVMTIQLANEGSKANSSTTSPDQQGQAGLGEDSKQVAELTDQLHQVQEQIAFLKTQVEGQGKQIKQVAEEESNIEEPLVKPINENTPMNQASQSSQMNQPTNQASPDRANSGDQNQSNQPEQPRQPRKRPRGHQANFEVDLAKVYTVLNEATHEAINQLKANWNIILGKLTPHQRVPFSGSEPLAAGDGIALISFANKMYGGTVQEDAMLRQRVEEIAKEIFDKPIQFTGVIEADWPQIRKNYMVLRKRNQGDPIDVAEFKPESAYNEEVVQEETTGARSQERPSDDSVESNSSVSDEKVSDNEPVKSSVDQADADEQASIQNMESLTNQASAELEQISNQTTPQQPEEPEGNSAESPLISKAVELFGEENINVYYDR